MADINEVMNEALKSVPDVPEVKDKQGKKPIPVPSVPQDQLAQSMFQQPPSLLESIPKEAVKALPGEFVRDLVLAEVLSRSTIVPPHFRRDPGTLYSAILYAKEHNIPVMTALLNLYDVRGRVAPPSSLMLAMAMRHPDWAGYEVLESTEEKCVIKIRRYVNKEKGEVNEITVDFTIEDAKRAGLLDPKRGDSYVKYPKEMLFAKAVARAVRAIYPDALAGVYSQEEVMYFDDLESTESSDQ